MKVVLKPGTAHQLRQTLVKLYEHRLESMQEKLMDGDGSPRLEAKAELLTFLVGELQGMEFVQ